MTPLINEASRSELTKYLGDIAQKRHKMEQHVEGARRAGVDQQLVLRFAEVYTEYISRLETALELRRSYRLGLSCQLDFVLSNQGPAPARDVKVTLEFPINSFVIPTDLIQYADLFFLVRNEPKPDWLDEKDALHFLSSYIPVPAASQPASIVEDKQIEGPIYDGPQGGHTVYYTNRKLRQGEPWHLEPLKVYLPLPVRIGFEIKYLIFCDDLPSPIPGRLNVVHAEAQ